MCMCITGAPALFCHLNRFKRRDYESPRTTYPTNIFASLFWSISLLLSCTPTNAAAGISVFVSSTGNDDITCSTASPCRTIAYAVNTRQATDLQLSNETFSEPTIHIKSSVFISGLRQHTVFDCSGRAGPAFVIMNTSITLSGITFQNCANFHSANGIGGALSAHSSTLAVMNCLFLNNSAQSGGAIGSTSSSLDISSSSFQNNTAICPRINVSCSAWAGAISANEALSLTLTGNHFSHNSVNLQSLAVTDANSQAAGGGGCVSVLYHYDVDGSRIFIDGNVFQSCSVQMYGLSDTAKPPRTLGVQYGNAYGGAVSLYYGLRAASSLKVQNATVTFNHNLCRSSGITASVGLGGNAYGGCLSVYSGTWNVNSAGSSVPGPVVSDSLQINISSNSFENCRALVTGSYGNAYGGGVSLDVGPYSYSNGGTSFVSGSTTVSNSSYTISNNSLSNCTATSTTNTYGGGISLFVGAYSYSRGSTTSSSISGDTLVSNSSYFIMSNSFFNCTASSAALRKSYGGNTYGGGISLFVGVYSFSNGSRSSSVVSGSTTVSNSSYTISSNSFSNCSASSSQSEVDKSYFSNSYGGGMFLGVGAYSQNVDGRNSSVSSSTTVSNNSYTISRNSLSDCTASSKSTAVISKSYGANAYGGGISFVFGAFSYCSGSSISSVSGSTAVVNNNYTIDRITLTSCSASSSSLFYSYGANAYGGGMSFFVGAYSYGSEASNSSSISGSTTASDCSFSFSSNLLSNCTASSYTAKNSYGANTYGGGLSFVLGAYSYSRGKGGSSVTGSTTVSNSSYTISNNSLSDCTATSLTIRNSYAGNTYGGGISLFVGAYSYSRGSNSFGDIEDDDNTYSTTVSDIVMISSFNVQIGGSFIYNCRSVSNTVRFSNQSSSFGGGVSLIYETYVYPKVGAVISNVQYSTVNVAQTTFRSCIASTKSSTCDPGSSNSTGGALFVFTPNVFLIVSSSLFLNCSISTYCAASSSETFSLGGGISSFLSGDVVINSTNFMNCFANGTAEANNVFVSGGGIFVRDSKTVTLNSTSVVSCGIINAFASLLSSGGGALGARNVPALLISNSRFYNNFDASSTGAIFLQQMSMESGMVVDVTNGSEISTSPSIDVALPALAISCGVNCSAQQQKRVRINFVDSIVFADSDVDAFRSAMVLSIPMWSFLLAQNSTLQCNFRSTDKLAVTISNIDDQTVKVSCAPCDKPFEIALTSSILNLNDFSSLKQQGKSCRSVNLVDSSAMAQHCPFGISYCSTILNVTAGFWVNFTRNGSVGDAISCPSNYCGCRISPNSSECLLQPIFSPNFQEHKNNALCNYNRTGVLCGSCKPNFTQSLNGYSCIPNDICLLNLGWVWAVTVLGYFLYSVYIVLKSVRKKSNGLIMCVLFYGQVSSFAGIPPIIKAQSQDTAASAWVSKITQFDSVLSLRQDTCYGLDMGAYQATLAQLSGPAIVFVLSLVLTYAAGILQRRFGLLLRKLEIEIRVNYVATLINVLLFLFSHVTSVAFQLITCVQIDDTLNVIFIDGTQSCSGSSYQGAVAAATLLSMVPFLLWVGLKFNFIPLHHQAVVCSAYKPPPDSRYYWIVIKLLFRLVVTLLSATAVQFPSVTALAMCICTVLMLVMLVALHPYADSRTLFFDIFCHACLIVQFLLQCVARSSESLGVSVTEDNSFQKSILDAIRASFVLRSPPLDHLFSRDWNDLHFFPRRYIPFAVCGLIIIIDVARPWLAKNAAKPVDAELHNLFERRVPA